MRLTGTAPLSGQVEIKQATLPAVDAIVGGQNYVELTGTIAAGNTYYFVVLPGEHTGFTLVLTDNAGASLDDFNYATYSGTPAPASYGRNADGVWYYQAATPGAENTDGADAVTGLE